MGFGDAADYATFSLAGAAKLSLTFKASDATGFTVYNSAGKAVVKSNLKAGATLTSKAVLLDKGSYRLVTESANARKGGDSTYSVTVNSKTVFYTKGDNSDDTKAEAVDKGVLSAGKQITSGWVGFGDAADWTRFNLAGIGRAHV